MPPSTQNASSLTCRNLHCGRLQLPLDCPTISLLRSVDCSQETPEILLSELSPSHSEIVFVSASAVEVATVCYSLDDHETATLELTLTQNPLVLLLVSICAAYLKSAHASTWIPPQSFWYTSVSSVYNLRYRCTCFAAVQ